IQPLILPLYGGKTAHELFLALSDRPDRAAHDLVKERTVGQAASAEDAELRFRRVIHDGIAGPAPAPEPPPRVPALRDLVFAPPKAGLELVFRPDPSTYDGRFANNAWLQELPRPFTKITWDNAALVSPDDARGMGLSTGDVVTLEAGGRSVRAPVWVMSGQAK